MKFSKVISLFTALTLVISGIPVMETSASIPDVTDIPAKIAKEDDPYYENNFTYAGSEWETMYNDIIEKLNFSLLKKYFEGCDDVD